MKRSPNILFILADDQGAWAMRCAGNADVRTPNLDRLASMGLRFENFFCASPVCSPARASILTGRMPSRHGIHDWLCGGNLDRQALGGQIDSPAFCLEDRAIGYLDGMTCYTDLLHEAGYACALSGKWHLGDSMRPQHGFESWYTIGRGGCGYFRPDIVEDGKLRFADGYVTDLFTGRALREMERLQGAGRPWYLSVHYTAPHSPWERAEHPERFWALYEGCDFRATPDLPMHPNQAPSAPRGTGERRKELLRGYYAAISAMDEGVGRLLDELERLDALRDTLVVFTSDNGMNMGHHGVWGKGNGTFPMNMYDTSVKVPMLVAQPGTIPSGRVIRSPHSHYDLIHTFADYLGIEWTSEIPLPGRSFASVLTSGADAPEKGVFICDEYGFTRMLRGDAWKLVKRYPYGPDELYDLRADPDEADNRICDPACRQVLASMADELARWFLRHADPALDGTREAVMGAGQLGRAGVYAAGMRTYRPYEDG